MGYEKNKLSSTKRTSGKKKSKVDKIWSQIKKNDNLMDDRREYDIGDLETGYQISRKEAITLYKKIQRATGETDFSKIDAEEKDRVQVTKDLSSHFKVDSQKELDDKLVQDFQTFNETSEAKQLKERTKNDLDWKKRDQLMDAWTDSLRVKMGYASEMKNYGDEGVNYYGGKYQELREIAQSAVSLSNPVIRQWMTL